MFLLDTIIVPELRKPKPLNAVLQWIENIADTDLYLSALPWAKSRLALDAATFPVWVKLMHR